MDLSQLRHCARCLPTFCLTAASLMFGSVASATLIGDSLEYDGHVKSGTATGVEMHAVAPAFPPTTFTLPVTNGPLAAPLQPAHALSGDETEYLDSYNGLSVQHVVITIQAQNPVDNTFVNPLDPGIALPIFFDGTFHTTLANKKVTIQHVGIENIPSSFFSPFPDPGSSVITGLGTATNPLHVQVNLAASQVASHRGALKLHLFYTTSTPPVPEPSTLLMLITGGLGMIGTAVRRRG